MGPGRRGGMGLAPAEPEEAMTIATLTYEGSVAPLPLPERLLPVAPVAGAGAHAAASCSTTAWPPAWAWCF